MPDDTPDELLAAITAEAYAAGRRDALAEAEFPQAFRIGDFVQVRQDGSAPREWCYDWARVRLRIIGTIIDDHVPGHVAYFVQADGYSRREHAPMAEHWLEAA